MPNQYGEKDTEKEQQFLLGVVIHSQTDMLVIPNKWRIAIVYAKVYASIYDYERCFYRRGSFIRINWIKICSSPLFLKFNLFSIYTFHLLFCSVKKKWLVSFLPQLKPFCVILMNDPQDVQKLLGAHSWLSITRVQNSEFWEGQILGLDITLYNFTFQEQSSQNKVTRGFP